MRFFRSFTTTKEIKVNGVKLLTIISIIGLFACGCRQNNIVDTIPIEQILIREINVSKIKKDGVAGIALSFKNPDTIFVLTQYSGIYRSVDGGKNFQKITKGLPQKITAGSYPYLLHNGITIDKRNPNVIYAAFNGQIYKSIDEGETWKWSSKGTTVRSYNLLKKANLIMGVAIDPKNPDHLLAGTIASGFFGGVFESKDGGNNWRQIAGSNKPFSGIGNDAWPLAFDPSCPDRVYACGVHEAFYYSLDRGRNWTRNDPEGEGDNYGASIFVYPDKPNQILLGDGRGPFLSKDYGKSWEPYAQLKGVLTSVEAAHSDSNIIYAISRSHGLYRTINGGNRWEVLGHKSKGLRNIAVHPTNPFIIYLGTYCEGIYRSTDGGEHLDLIGKGLPESSKWWWIKQILPDPKNPNTIYAVEWDRGLYKSMDRGNTWKFLKYGKGAKLTISPDSRILYLSNLEGLHRSCDGGGNWRLLYELKGETLAYALSPHNNEVIWLVDNAKKKVLQSKDGGNTWNIQSEVKDYVTEIVVDPTEPSRIYLATDNYPQRSDDYGKTWKILKRGIRGKYTKEIIHSLVVAPSGEVFTFSQGGGAYRSENQGKLWEDITPSLLKDGPQFGKIVLSGTGLIFIASEKGLFISKDKGNTWVNVGSSISFDAVAPDPHQPSRFYAGGREKMYLFESGMSSF
jgi:photosystem II stability/assembly factor-like uncharacterized protein